MIAMVEGIAALSPQRDIMKIKSLLAGVNSAASILAVAMAAFIVMVLSSIFGMTEDHWSLREILFPAAAMAIFGALLALSGWVKKYELYGGIILLMVIEVALALIPAQGGISGLLFLGWFWISLIGASTFVAGSVCVHILSRAFRPASGDNLGK